MITVSKDSPRLINGMETESTGLCSFHSNRPVSSITESCIFTVGVGALPLPVPMEPPAQSFFASIFSNCPLPGCVDCIAKMPNPARELQLKKHIPLLPFPKTPDDGEKLDMWISTVRKTLHSYGRATPFLLEQIECGLLESLVLLVGSPRPYISPFALDIMEWLSRDSPSTAQKIASLPALPTKLLKVFESGLVTEKQFASNLVIRLNLNLARKLNNPTKVAPMPALQGINVERT